MAADHSSSPTPQSTQLRVFLAEDDRELRRMVAIALRRDGHFVLESVDGPALLSDLGFVFHAEPPDTVPSLVISDIRMPGIDGLAIFRSVRQNAWCPPFVFLSAFVEPTVREEASQLGARAVFAKPFDLAELRALVAGIAEGATTRAT